MALKGVKVLEFVGLAPAPFCGKILSDFGASVTRLDRIQNNPLDVFQGGKKTLVVNLKDTRAQDLIKSLSKRYDVLIDPYRPGVLEKHNLGPQILQKENSKLIYARLTGFGQSGPLANRAGHDINYVALSGILSFLGRKDENPLAPINLLADFAGGGLLCAFGICMALLEREKSGKGQIIDNSMVEGCAYIASWLMMSQNLPIWGKNRGENILDTGSFFYEIYKTKDGKYMSVGAIEKQFFDEFIKGLGLENLSQFDDNENSKKIVQEKFLTKTQEEWCEIFEDLDACVYPVLDWHKAYEHRHNKHRGSFDLCEDNDLIIPKPAPRLSRTPGVANREKGTKNYFDDAVNILKDIGLDEKKVKEYFDSGVIKGMDKTKL